MRVPSVLVYLVCFAAACGSVETLGGDGGGGDDGGGHHDGGSDGSGSGDNNGGYKSGTRLKYEWYSFGGVKLPYAIYDSQLQFECETLATDDAMTSVLCVPQGYQVVYADASCSTRMVLYSGNSACPATAPAYGLDQTYDGCASIVNAVYPVTSTTPTSLTSYYQKNTNGTCGLAQDGTPYTFYAVGPATDLSSFARITLPSTTSGGPTRLTQLLATSTDGFTLPEGYFDSTLHTECNLSSPWDSADHGTCNPSSQADDDYYYSNSSCTSHVATSYGTCAGAVAPKYAYYQNPNQQSCPYRDAQYDSITGQGVAATSAYYSSGGECFPTGLSDGTTLYPSDGVPITLDSVPRSPDSGSGVQLVHFNDGANQYIDFTMYDSTHHEYCYPIAVGDGSVHCLNQQNQTQTFYTDASCTAQADFVMVYSAQAGCTQVDPPTYAIKYLNTQSCTGNSIEVHQVTSLFSGTLYQNFGECEPQSFSGENIYQVGATLPLSEFPAATKTTDP